MQRKSLIVHMKRHEKSESFRKCCDLCPSRFPTKKEIASHVLKHRSKKQTKDEKPRTKQDKNLISRPFQCDLCSKFYASKMGLKKHILSLHFKKFEYRCSTCSKKFSEKASVKRHQIVHVKEKNFECKSCGMKFASLQYLKGHEKRIHGEKVMRKFGTFNLLLCLQFRPIILNLKLWKINSKRGGNRLRGTLEIYLLADCDEVQTFYWSVRKFWEISFHAVSVKYNKKYKNDTKVKTARFFKVYFLPVRKILFKIAVETFFSKVSSFSSLFPPNCRHL